MKANPKIDPFRGIVKPEQIVQALKKLRDSERDAAGYIRGVIRFYEKNPPNELIIPFLRRALEKFK